MEDKIKIHLSKEVYDTLLKDCEVFEFYKKDHISLNKNAFLITLINNYYLLYQSKENELLKIVDDVLKEHIEIKDKSYLERELVNKLNRLNISPNKEKVSYVISLKPTKDSVMALSYIENYLLKDISVSEFFRNLFSSYASLPQDQRETIIFKKQYETILKAIKQHKKLFFTTKRGGEIKHEAMPYDIVTSKEEMHYYLLAKYHDNFRTYRLDRILDCTIINEEVSFTDDDIKVFNKMIKYGPEFLYEKDEETVIVRLTPNGQEMFKTHYTHRPIPDFVEKEFYTFNCSYNQIYNYFRRFGKDAFIITPSKLQLKMYHFHKKAVEFYDINVRKLRH